MKRVKELIRFCQINQDCKRYFDNRSTELDKFEDFCEMGENEWIKMNLTPKERYYLKYHDQERARKRYDTICHIVRRELSETDFLEFFDHEKEWIERYLFPEETLEIKNFLFRNLLEQIILLCISQQTFPS